jgi:hypothetical protein
MLVYLHSLDIDLNSFYSFKDQYTEKFKEICTDKQCTYAEVYLWIAEKQGLTRQLVI